MTNKNIITKMEIIFVKVDVVVVDVFNQSKCFCFLEPYLTSRCTRSF